MFFLIEKKDSETINHLKSIPTAVYSEIILSIFVGLLPLTEYLKFKKIITVPIFALQFLECWFVFEKASIFQPHSQNGLEQQSPNLSGSMDRQWWLWWGGDGFTCTCFAHLSTTSVAWFPMGHGLVPVCEPGIGDPCFRSSFKLFEWHFLAKVTEAAITIVVSVR